LVPDKFREVNAGLPKVASVVKVKFESGSEVSFTLGWSDDLENVRFHKKHDAVSESTEALMERFNNQKAK